MPTLIIDNFAYPVDAPSTAPDERDREQENILFAREQLEEIRRHHRMPPTEALDPIWVVAGALAQFYRIPVLAVYDSWRGHYGSSLYEADATAFLNRLQALGLLEGYLGR